MAALLTLVGYSVNDTIVVFDRIREVRGKNPELTPKMINDSVNQTLSRTLLTSLTTWLVVIVLYMCGGPGVHLFAFVMVVGVIVGTYSSIYIASPLLLMFGEGRPRWSPSHRTPALRRHHGEVGMSAVPAVIPRSQALPGTALLQALPAESAQAWFFIPGQRQSLHGSVVPRLRMGLRVLS